LTKFWLKQSPNTNSTSSAVTNVAALIVAAGSGVRLGASVPKALLRIGDKSLLEHSVDSLCAHPSLRCIVVAAPASHVDLVIELLAGRATVIVGGASRQASVQLGLAALPADIDVVLVHDAARPFVPVDVIDRVLAAIDGGASAAIPGLAVTDTIKRVDAQGDVTATVDRADLRAVQTPQGFRLRELILAHQRADAEGWADSTDDAALVERAGGRVAVVDGADEAFKITRPWDLRLAELMVAER
jgi:2-C-methyl-D-erythritol 4-phosphate cytidylyltransferase